MLRLGLGGGDGARRWHNAAAFLVVLLIEIAPVTAYPRRAPTSLEPDLLASAEAEALPPIDAVVTWVDSTDPGWRRSYELHTGEAFQPANATDPRTRFSPASADPEAELSMCLELIRRNLPWVRRTYVVTARPQRPRCLKDEVLVHHDALGLGTVFNSHAVESSLHRIPGLAERFVYFNDDFYVRRPVSRGAFLTPGGLPLVRVEHMSAASQECAWEQPHLCKWERTNALAALAAEKHVRAPLEAVLPKHVPHMLTRAMLLAVESGMPAEWAVARGCVLRYECDEMAPIVAAMLLALHSGAAINASSTADRTTVALVDTLPKDLAALAKVRDADFVCINAIDGDRAALRRALQLAKA